MKRDLYIITTITNLHVGAGDINFDIVDNQVQRDAITNLPTIHSSSLKGAFREAFGENNASKYIFGSPNSDNDHQAGAFNFFEASLLSRPVRSNQKPYFMATSPEVIGIFLEFLENFEIDFEPKIKKVLQKLKDIKVASESPIIFENITNTILEDFEATFNDEDISDLDNFLGDNLAIFNHKDFQNLTLPVIARNYLENGESKNLWYEEVVPKKSKFYFAIAKPTNLDPADAKDKLEGFEKRFDNQSRVQFGGNKSIGYGFCRLEKVSK